MSTLYIRDCPESLHQKLTERAQAERRSLNAEVIALLEASMQTDDLRRQSASLLARVARRRKGLTPATTDAVELIREDRGR